MKIALTYGHSTVASSTRKGLVIFFKNLIFAMMHVDNPNEHSEGNGHWRAGRAPTKTRLGWRSGKLGPIPGF